MINRLTICVRNWGLVGCAATMLLLSPVHAQVARVPLPVEQLSVMTDQFQAPLNGTDGDLVHVLAANGLVHPPNPENGQPHPTNTILFTTRVGAGIFNPAKIDGRFVTAIHPRPESPFVVRVYNAKTTQEATFYADSAIFSPVVSNDVAFFPQMLATTNPINPTLAPDGLSASMKESLGLNPNTTDTDGDGISDKDELRMGTDANNAGEIMPELVVNMDKNGKVTANWEIHTPQNINVLNALGLTPITTNEMVQMFDGSQFSMQRNAGGMNNWADAMEGEVGVNPWPPSMNMPASTNNVQFFRFLMEVPK